VTRGFLILGFMLLPCFAQAQEAMTQAEFIPYAQERLTEVGRLWQDQEIERAVAILEDLAAHKEIRDFGSVWQATLYNLACGYAILGRTDEALAHLREAIEAGYADVGQIEQDPDLSSIRGSAGFRDLLQRLRSEVRFWENPALDTPYRENISPEEKVAGLSKVWSEVKYNFVFFDRVPYVDWDSLYVAYLPRVERTTSTLEYYRLLQEMAAHLEDGHTRVNMPHELYDRTSYRPAIRTRLIQDRVLIVEVGGGAEPPSDPRILPGMEVVRVDGIPVREYAARTILPYVSASTEQARDVWAYDYDLLLGPKGTQVELELKDGDGHLHIARLERTTSVMVKPPTEPEVRLLPGNIACLTLKSFADSKVVTGFDSLLASIAECQGLIIDLRDNGGGNSDVGYTLLGYLAERPFAIEPCADREYRPMRRALGLKNQQQEEAGIEWPTSGSRHSVNPVAVLIGPRTGSAAEDFCVAFRSLQRGKLIGEPTAGSSGQPLIFGLPGGGNATVCTAHCKFPDGTEFVGVGIKPDIEVPLTVMDVVEGRDAALEAALGYIRQGTDPGQTGRESAGD
jgi:carboxyl-terminal processing protease